MPITNPPTSEAACRNCGAAMDATDSYCRRCGTPVPGIAPLPGNTSIAWWESPWVVLPLLFVVLGPFALPLLWRSRKFNLAWKIALSVVVVGITIYATWQIWQILNQALAPILELGK